MISTIVPWFGSNRTLAPLVARELGPLSWCGVPFLGGGSELLHINTRSGVASDRHLHLINLCRVVASIGWKGLLRYLREIPFHEKELLLAQQVCKREAPVEGGLDVRLAANYFVCCWMSRSADAGTAKELSSTFAVRYTSSGGDSAVRFANAVKALRTWRRTLSRWSFVCDDWNPFLERCFAKPLPPGAKHGCYLDPPWVEEGGAYLHSFSKSDHLSLARGLNAYNDSHPGWRIVLRYADHPLIRSLYPSPTWRWVESTSRSQANTAVKEVLIINGPPLPE